MKDITINSETEFKIRQKAWSCWWNPSGEVAEFSVVSSVDLTDFSILCLNMKQEALRRAATRTPEMISSPSPGEVKL